MGNSEIDFFHKEIPILQDHIRQNAPNNRLALLFVHLEVFLDRFPYNHYSIPFLFIQVNINLIKRSISACHIFILSHGRKATRAETEG
jgi:hypothetical protein